MRALLAELGDPQLAFPSIHVVGTNGKSTTTRMIAALLRGEGAARRRLHVARTSPAGTSGSTPTRTGFERAVARVRPAAERARRDPVRDADRGRAGGVRRAAATRRSSRPASAGGSTRRTCSARRSSCSPTSASSTPTCSARRARRSRAEKLAVVRDGATVVLCEPEWQALAVAGACSTVAASNLALAVAAAETFLGRPVDPAAAEGLSAPRPPRAVAETPLEIWDGAHTLDGVGWLLPRLPDRRYVVVASILRDKDVDGMLAALSAVGRHARRDARRRTRAPCPPTNLQRLGVDGSRERRRWRPRRKRSDAHASSPAPDGAVLVTGSLYLLADLAARREDVPSSTDPTQRLRLRRDRDRRICRNRVRGGVRRRKDAPLMPSFPLAADTTTDNGLFNGVNDFFNSGTWLVIRNLAIFFVVVFWLASDLLGLQGRAPADRGPVAGRDGDAARASWCRSSGRSSTCSSGRPSTSRTSASASSRSGRWRSGSAARRALPGVPRRGGARVPRLPGLHDEAEAGVRDLQGAARAALAGVPVLRDADRPPLAGVRGDDGAARRRPREPLRSPRRPRERIGWDEDSPRT